MSIRLMSIVWEIGFPTHAQKLVALKLADYASDSGSSIFPAINTIAVQTGSDERHIQRIMKAFRACGLITLVKEGGTGPKSTNQWQLNLALLTSLSRSEAQLCGTAAELAVEENKGDILSENKGDILSSPAPARVTSCPNKGDILSPKGGSHATQPFTIHQIESSRSLLLPPLPPSDRPDGKEQNFISDLKGEGGKEVGSPTGTLTRAPSQNAGALGEVRELTRYRAEALGLPIDEIIAAVANKPTRSLDAYVQAICRKRLRERLPAASDDVLRAAFANPKGLAVVVDLLMRAGA